MYTICKGELQASYVMHGILWKEMDFYFVVGCKMDKFRKEIPGLLEVKCSVPWQFGICAMLRDAAHRFGWYKN